MYKKDRFRLLSITNTDDRFFDFLLDSGTSGINPLPGQFAHILCGGKTLRRPISICDFDSSKNMFRLVFEVRGEGTRILSKSRVGDFIDAIIPIGNGYTIFEGKRALLVGGGIGVPPLLYCARKYGKNCDAVLGFANKASMILRDDFSALANEVYVTTDDGSFGTHGFVTEVVEKLIAEKKYDIIYSCGPSMMQKALSELAIRSGVECQVSLEERMACGVGACLGCACLIRTPEGEKYLHVCKNGPVFDAKEVVWQ